MSFSKNTVKNDSSQIYEKTQFFNSDIGGNENDLLKTKKYIDDQTDIIVDHNKREPQIDTLNNQLDVRKDLQSLNLFPKPDLSSYDKNKNMNKQRYDPYLAYIATSKYSNEKQVKYDTAYVNIDSSKRILSTQITTAQDARLDSNPLTFTKNSTKLFIQHPKNTFVKGDRITITGLSPISVTLKTIIPNGVGIKFISTTPYIKIYYPHGIPIPSSNYNISGLMVGISGISGNSDDKLKFNNVPINFINTTHQLVLSDSKYTETATADPNYFFLAVPLIITGTTTINASYNFKIIFYYTAGIPINEINATYPISVDNLQEYQTITEVSDDGYYIILPRIASQTITTGGGNIIVSKITEINTGYPNPNNYTVSLDIAYRNVVMIEMISSEFPNSQKLIRSTGDTQNNMFYWENFDDGEHIYSVGLDSGNYTPEQLIFALEQKIFDTKRVGYSKNNNQSLNHNYMDISIDQSTDIVTFNNFQAIQISKPFTTTIPVIPTDPDVGPVNPVLHYQVEITQPNHGLSVGSTFIIENALSYLGIPADILNGTHTVTSINSTYPDKYTFTLDTFNLNDTRVDNGGGINVVIKTPIKTRLLFNSKNTFGDILGFRNVGESDSITQYNTSIKNIDYYQNEADLVAYGKTVTVTPIGLNFSGSPYMLLNIQEIERNLRNLDKENSFTKILLKELPDIPGKKLYNKHIHTTKIYNEPLPELKTLTITITTPEGNLYDFNGLNHSFTLAITTVMESPLNTQISSRTSH